MTREFTQPPNEEIQKACDEMNAPESMQLNMQVAEKLGWKDLEIVSTPHLGGFTLQGISPAFNNKRVCPDWATNKDDALKLLPCMKVDKAIFYNGPMDIVKAFLKANEANHSL